MRNLLIILKQLILYPWLLKSINQLQPLISCHYIRNHMLQVDRNQLTY